MLEGDITQESNRDLWDALRRQWELEHRPGWLVTGSSTYTIIRPTGDLVIFRPVKGGGEGMYESTAFK